MKRIPWAERSTEEARLLNPAFIGATITVCAAAYQTDEHAGLPYPLAFIAVPVVLHKPTREALPRSISTTMASWLTEYPRVHIGFADRARALVPLVKEAIIFASNGDLLAQADAQLVPSDRRPSMRRYERVATDDVKACLKKAEFVGRWFARSGDYATVMALWGVAP